MAKIFLKIFAIAFLMVFSLNGYSQGGNEPADGSIAVGFSMSPSSIFKTQNYFVKGDFVGNSIISMADAPAQMYFLSQIPMVSISLKYKMSSNLNLKGSVGVSGASLNYNEYVIDDAAFAIDPFSNKMVFDNVNFKMSSGTVVLGAEYSAGDGNLKFNGGASLLYSFGNGGLNFTYGNTMTDLNQSPSNIGLVDSLNNWAPTGDMPFARPTKRYNVGLNHGFGIMANLGLEWFCAQNLSIGGEINFTPVFMAFQSQTYTTYEGYSNISGKVISYNKLVSPGSNYVLYGTDNFGIRLGIHYYF